MNELAKKGAQPAKPTRYGVLWIDSFYDGVVTQRNPLRGNAPHIEAEFYGSRPDTALSGLNCEISPKLTLIRRPGHSVYNSQNFPGINRYYSFSPVINGSEQIKVIADVQATSAPSATYLVTSTESVYVITGYTPLHVPIYGYFVVVTFATTLPATTSGQTYSFSGLTNYTTLNGQVLSPVTPPVTSGITLTSSQAMFSFGSFAFGTAADTGQAVVSPIPGQGATVRNVTGPSTNTILWDKNPDAKTTSFQGVGNTLYFSDGVSANKLVESAIIWKANTSYLAGQYIVDSNGNLQLNVGSQTGNIANIEITSGIATLFLDTGTSLTIPVGTKITLSGLTTVIALNGTTQTATGNANSQQVQFANVGSQPYTTETGQVTTGNGISGSSEPTWSTTLYGITQDGGAQWENQGPQVETWGITTPSVQPTVTQADAPSVYPDWTASTWYAPLFVILDSNGNLQKLTSIGAAPHQTGGTAPTWSTVTGATTSDGDVTWTCLGTGAWVASTPYVVGDIIQATFTYYITTTYQDGYDYWGNPIYVTTQQPVTADCVFECTAAGTSGTSTPNWTNGLGTTTSDNGVVWLNQSGPTVASWPGATQTLSLAPSVLDTNNNIQKATILGESGASAPTWSTILGGYTSDGTELWKNVGPFGKANTGAWIYAYSYKNSITGHISTASQQSDPIVVSAGKLAVIQGAGSADSQVDTIVIWRTVQGGSSLFFLDEISNPGSGKNWVYTDTIPDTSLNELISAPIDGVNDPPPTGLVALTYHLGRIWGAVNNLVYFSTGPDVTAGNGNEAWSASNVFAFPETVSRLFPMPSGLLVFTISDIYIIQGLGTSSSAFFAAPFLKDFGLVSYDAFAVNGSIIFFYSSDNQVLTLDPSSGASEIGFPIGDQFGPDLGSGSFTPSNTFVTWHVSGSQDKGLYVSDFNGIWWRMTPTPSPETGITWSPKAQIVGGFSAVQSVEVTPGTHQLLLGPKTLGPILKRDYSVYSDNGSAYNAWVILGSIVLAQPGQIATLESFTSDSKAVGSNINLAIQLDEIAPYYGIDTIAVANDGLDYTIGDIVAVTYTGGSGGLAQVTSISGGGSTGPVTGLSLLLPGEGYPTTGTGLPTTGGTGSGLTVNITSLSYFETLSDYVPDPTQLEPSKSIYAQRFYVSQTQQPAKCRHVQVFINWGSDTVKNELLSMSLFGGFDQEK